MAQKPLSQREIERTRDALQRTLNADGSTNLCAASRMLGIPRPTLQHRVRCYDFGPLKRFTVPELPSALPSIDELLERLTEQGERSIASEDARNLIPVTLHIEGPIGIWIWGDVHLGDNGCNLRLIRQHVELSKHPAIFSLVIGDVGNFWPGRLARLYAHQSSTSSEEWMLVEWFLNQHDHLAVVMGNHDLFVGDGNPMDWILRHQGGVTEPHGVRLALRHPCGSITRLHARHDFPGRSQYNPTHGQRRELAFGYRDHILVAGHTHHGADQCVIGGDGMVSQLVRVSSYKFSDDYARQGNFPVSRLHPSALAIIDPGEPETSRARVWVAPTVETGVKFLTMLRGEYEARHKGARKARGRDRK